MDLFCSLTEFFHGALKAALSRKKVVTNELTEFYLVNLLTQYGVRSGFDDEPIALKMAVAMDETGVEARAQKLREVGDTSLYVSGFFSESLERRLIDADYYIQMGGVAYRRLSQIARFSREASFGSAYGEMSLKFRELVGVLNDVSESHALNTPGGIVKLYEKWERTRDEELEMKLRAHGVNTTKGEVA